MKYSHSPHDSCRGLAETTAVLEPRKQKGPQQQLAEYVLTVKVCSKGRLGFTSVWYEMLSWARAEWAEIDSLRWSTSTKQLSGQPLQKEYWRRPISAGTGPSRKHYSQPGDRTLRLSLLGWFITQAVKKDPNWSDRGSAAYTTGTSSQSFHYPLHTPSVSQKRDTVRNMSKITEKVVWQNSKVGL